MAYLLGIDISTTSAKALLIDETGKVTASVTSEYPMAMPQPLWVEQNPEDWWHAACASIQQALTQAGVKGRDVKAIGLTGQMHGLVMLGQHGQLLRPAILWNDQRTAKECEEITQRIGFKRLLSITGNQALTGFTMPKILWVKKNEPEVYSQTAHILLPKDYVRYRLTDKLATDKADGSGMLLFDLNQRNWSEELIHELEIPIEWLPQAYEGPEITGEISRNSASETGLEPGTPVVAGGGDQVAQAVGVGVVLPGLMAITLGTSGVVFASSLRPIIEPFGRVHAFCHAVPATWHLMGVMLSAAGSLRWFRDTLSPAKSYDELDLMADGIQPGSEGLFFLPYLSGERTPHPDPLARAAFVGLTMRHTQAHLVRAVLEGVGFGLRDCLELIRNAGVGVLPQARFSGGGASSRVWRMIIANILGIELETVNTTEGAAFGAALLAGVGFGLWNSVSESCQATIRIIETTSPNPIDALIYTELYPQYQALYPALKPTFDAAGNTANR